MTAILKAMPMNHEESKEREEREIRYKGSQEDITVIRKELNKLGAAVGEILTALKGDDMGNDGLAKRVKQIEELGWKLKTRVDDIEAIARTKEKYLFGFVAVVSAVIGVIISKFIDHFAKK